MADGITITSGAASTPPNGTIIATDDAGGAVGHIQLFKLAYSANGVATLVQVDANGVLVNIGSGSVTASGSLSLQSASTGGYTGYGNIDLDEAKVAVKASAGTLGWFYCVNLTAADLFLKFWDVASGSVTVGTTAATYVFPVPISSGGHTGAVAPVPVGLAFATAITMACVTGVGTASSAGPAANGCTIVLGYK